MKNNYCEVHRWTTYSQRCPLHTRAEWYLRVMAGWVERLAMSALVKVDRSLGRRR